MAVNKRMGSAPPTQERGSYSTSVSTTAQQLSGPVTGLGTKISSPVTQVSGTVDVYAFLQSKNANPTGIYCTIYAGPTGAENVACPDISGVIIGVTSADISAQGTNTWTRFPFTGVSLSGGLTYWTVLNNNTSTPITNNATYLNRGYNGNSASARFLSYITTNGFLTSPTVGAAGTDFPIVIKFNDGSVFGNPYVQLASHANDANDRGNRYRFNAYTVVNGLFFGMQPGANCTGIKIYQGVNELVSITPDLNQLANAVPIYFSNSITLAPGIDYDVVAKFSTNTSSVGSRVMPGAGAPDDVYSCMPTGLSYIDGATPGSYTVTGGMTAIFLLLNEIVAGESSATF